MNHQTIKQAFDQAANHYDQHALLQQHIGLELVSFIKNGHFANTIDLGCGTGMTTLALAQAIHFSNFTAIDFAPKAINIAKARLKHFNIKCRLGNFDRINAPKNHFDLIFSSMSLQWSLDLPECLKKIHQHLKSSGLLAFALPLAGSLCEVSQHINQLQLPTAASITTIFQSLDFKCRQMQRHKYQLVFANKFEALQSIKKIGAHTHNKQQIKNKLCRQELTTKQINTLTYNIAYFVLEK